MKTSARAIRYIIFFCLTLLFIVSFHQLIIPTSSVLAQAATPTPAPASPGSQWVFDPDVTELGKNSDRARQFLWWVFSHPGVHSAPVLTQLWAFSRNIIYVFIVLVIIAFGFSFILLRKRASAVSIPPILVKIGAVLLYVTFSYILILALIQTSEIIMRFFIENVGGKDLFNVFFGGSENAEANYISFVGFRNVDPLIQESVRTSMTLIRLTSFTYYALSIILILRTIILWFLLIISPFLAILLPFIFIRNIGLIWIGVFFQWLFYGPLLSLFLWGTTMIWKAGIPYSFDFSRVDQPAGQVYKTAINILYGGPAQLVSAGNSANYVDTYAEYIISLIMLWTAIILPWLLLRIFRDYCCAVIASGNATLSGIFDRIRQYPPPAPSQPVTPATTAGMAVELPFRTRVEEKITEVQKTRIEDIKEISRVETSEIAKSMNLSVSSIADISRLELNQTKRNEVNTQLNKLAAPQAAPSRTERERLNTIITELKQRAASGDKTAQTLLYASEKNKEVLADRAILLSTTRSTVTTPVKTQGLYAPSSSLASYKSISQTTINNIAKQVGVSEEIVREVLANIPINIPITGLISTQILVSVAQKTGLPSSKVHDIISGIQIAGASIEPSVSIDDYEEVKTMWLNHYRGAPIPLSDTIKDRSTWLEDEERKLTNIYNLLSSSDPKLKQKGFEQVAEILPFMLLGGFSDVETLAYIKAKIEAVKQVKTETEAKEVSKKEEEDTLIEVSQPAKEEKQTKQNLESKIDLPTNEENRSEPKKSPKA